MKNNRSVKDVGFILVAWLLAAALVYLLFIKFKLFFH